MSTSAGAPFWICVASVPVLPNEYVLPRSMSGSTCVSDEPAKTVRPPAARAGAADAAPLTTAAARSARTIGKRTRTPFLARVGAHGVGGLLDRERRREGEVERPAAEARAEVRRVLRLARRDLREARLE